MRRTIYVDYYLEDDETVIILPYCPNTDMHASISYRYHAELITLLDRRDINWCEQWRDPGIGSTYKFTKVRSYTFLNDKANMYFIPREQLTQGAAMRLIEDLHAIVAVDCEENTEVIRKRTEPLGVIGEL